MKTVFGCGLYLNICFYGYSRCAKNSCSCINKLPSPYAIFREYSLSAPSALQWSGHPGNILKKKNFLKVFDEKVVFVWKVHDLIITNIDLLANSSNRKVMFPEYSKNIPRMSVSKSFQGYSWNILRLWIYFLWSQKVQNIVLWVILWNFGSLISWMFFWTLLKPFFNNALESFMSMLDSWQKIKN